MIANLAHKTVSEETEEKAYKKAEQAGSGSIAAKARMDVSDAGERMSLDERIEAEHQASMAAKAEAEAEPAASDAVEAESEAESE